MNSQVADVCGEQVELGASQKNPKNVFSERKFFRKMCENRIKNSEKCVKIKLKNPKKRVTL